MHRPLPPVRFCLYRDGISRGTGGCEDPDDGQTKPVTENASSFAWSVLVLTKIQFNETFQYFKNEISNYTYNFHTYGQSALVTSLLFFTFKIYANCNEYTCSTSNSLLIPTRNEKRM